jgi:hypothetical protein
VAGAVWSAQRLVRQHVIAPGMRRASKDRGLIARIWFLGAVAMGALAAAGLVLALGASGSEHRRTADSPVTASDPGTRSTLPAALTIPAAARLEAFPHSFLGLSTEYTTLPVDERHIALQARDIDASCARRWTVRVAGGRRFV